MHGVGTWVLTYQSLMKSFAWALPKVAKVLVPGVNADGGTASSATVLRHAKGLVQSRWTNVSVSLLVMALFVF